MKSKKVQSTNSLDSETCQHLRPFLEYLLKRHKQQGGITELLAGPSLEQTTHVGYFKPEDLDTAVSLLTSAPAGKGKGGKHPRIGEAVIAYNPHPVQPKLYTRSPAKFTKCQPADTSDLVASSMFAIRVEPHREEESRATDDEHQQAGLVGREIALLLKENEVPFIVIAVAGNGYELLVPTIPYENVAQAAANAEEVLQLIAAEYSNDAVSVGRINSGCAVQHLPLPGMLLARGDPATEPLTRFVCVRNSLPAIQDEVDLFALLAEDLAEVSTWDEPDDPPDEPDEPVKQTSSKKKQSHDAQSEGSTGESAVNKPTKPRKKKQAAVPQPAVTEQTHIEQAQEPDDDPELDDTEDADEPDELPIAKPRTKLAPVAQWDQATTSKVLAAVLQRAKLAYQIKDQAGEQLYLFKDCPVADGADAKSYRCCIVVQTDGTFAVRCRHDEHLRWKEMKPLISWDDHIRKVLQELDVPPRSLPYRSTDTGLIHLLKFKTRTERVRLSNFTARILRDVEEDDGIERRHTFEVEAKLGDQTIRCTLTAAQFASMTWPLECLGAGAILYPAATKPLLRAAIQELSGGIAAETVSKHTGWRQHNGQWVYLHAGGAIGQDGAIPGIRIDLPEQLSRYRLPPPPEGTMLRDAVCASLRVLEVAPDEVVVPLFAGIWRSVVGPADFGEHLVGDSGSGKTALAALNQQHFGAEMDAQHQPATWLSTANSNELLAFHAKDALLVVDDFVLLGSKTGSARQHQEADRLFRSQGNSAGRGRMRSDATLQPTKPPRGLLISTGEATPRGQSLRARLLVLKLGPGMVKWDKITACQQDAGQGLYTAALSGYIRWLAPQINKIREEMPARLATLRQQATSGDLHKRTPGIVAHLAYGLELFSQYAITAKAMNKKQAQDFLDRCWTALGEAAAAQAEVQGNGDPAQRFLSLLKTALASGKAHATNTKGKQPDSPQCWGWRQEGESWSACGTQIAWVDGNVVYLDSDVAFAVARSLAEGGEPLTVGEKTLHKRLHEGGFLVQTDKKRDRLLVRKTLAGKLREVIAMTATALVSQPTASAPVPVTTPPVPPEVPSPAPAASASAKPSTNGRARSEKAIPKKKPPKK